MSASRPVSALSALSDASVAKEKPRTRAKAAPKIAPTTTRQKSTRSTTRKSPAKSVGTTAKPKKSKVTSGSIKKATGSKSPSSRPTWKDLIRECITINKDDARVGVSRTMIKKFAEERYGLEMNPMNLYQLGRAITSGTEEGLFTLPKGTSGKVKLAPKTPKPSATKENAKPPSKTTTTTTKKSIAKPTSKTPQKKVLTGAKSSLSNRKTSSASKRVSAAKKAVTGVAPGMRAKAIASSKKKKSVARK